tara:strand:+ start:181 stop:1179 length:999 start_codon:yes stop_codon:yes gene_type:complete
MRVVLAFALTLAVSAACVSDLGRVAYKPPVSPVQRCMNLSGALEGPSEGVWGYTVRMSDIDRIADAGFDTIRLPVRWSAHADHRRPYELDSDMLARTDEIIDHALAKGMKVILNVHHYHHIHHNPSRHERRLEGIWKQLAAHYAAYPDTLIFEVLNEPNTKMTVKRTDALNKRIVALIRKTQPDRWIILATAEWGSLTGLIESQPPHDPRIILSWHYYDPFSFTHQGVEFFKPTPPAGAEWGSEEDQARMAEDFRAAASFRDTHGMPLLLGEFGVFDAASVDERVKWISTVRHLSESNQFGWCHWGFSSNFRAYDPEKEAWIEPIRAALMDD